LASSAEEAFMRTIALAAAALAALCLTSFDARADGTWCAYDTRGGTNCGFHNYAQCRADISGIGGFCNRNPAFRAYGREPGTRGRNWQRY
jgi:hypothetical protein